MSYNNNNQMVSAVAIIVGGVLLLAVPLLLLEGMHWGWSLPLLVASFVLLVGGVVNGLDG